MVKIPSVKKMSINYLTLKKKLIRNSKFLEKLKLFFSISMFVLSIWAYGYFVNVASTKWYFLKVEKEKLQEVNFQNEIVKIDTKKKEWEILTSMISNVNIANDDLKWKIVYIKRATKLVYNPN